MVRENERNGRMRKETKEVVTWNMQRVSLREMNRRRLRRMVEFAERKEWEIVLMSELSDDDEGVLWLGEGERQVAIVHGRRAGVMLRGGELRQWMEEGQKKWLYERVAAVSVGGVRWIAVYQPVWRSDEGAMERYRRDLESQMSACRSERLVIGGDFNANVGKDGERQGVCGKYGLGRMNDAGRDLIDWCEENGLAWVNSFVRHKSRGTWFNRMYGRWYELDGFIVRKKERQRLVRRMRTVNENALSDHKPKSMRVRVDGRRWRATGGDRRRTRVKWEVLKDERKREEYKEATRVRMEAAREGNERGEEDGRMEWNRVTEVMIESAVEVCGEESGAVTNPWLVGHEEEIEHMRREVTELVNARNAVKVRLVAVRRLRRANLRARNVERELEGVKRRLKDARKRLNDFLKVKEREWWRERIEECKEACERGRMGDMYKVLRVIGRKSWKKAPVSTSITASEFKEHFERVSEERYEREPGEIRATVERACDLRMDEKAREANEMMNESLTREEIVEAIGEIKESAPGMDEVRIGYIRNACEEVKDAVIGMVQFMFEKRAHKWDEVLKTGMMCPLFKKGDRMDRGNYRGVCLLAMGSRILARVLSKRLRWWAEHLDLMDESQCGFREGRSTADVTQVVIRMKEDVDDYMRRRENVGMNGANENDRPVARLLDLEKAYPRVSKPALWMLLERYGMNGRCLETVMDLHETTEYRVKGKDGLSEAWTPARGLREGCSTSPILFNIFHQAVLRQAGEARAARSEEQVGVTWRWVPGSSFAGGEIWEKGGTEVKDVRITELLFADDTTIVGKFEEMDEGVNAVKGVMNEFEERSNEAKEECLEFCKDEGNGIRVLGSWVGAEEDVKERIKRASGLWAKVKEQLKNTRLSKRWQGRIVEACVESGLLYDCQARMWWKKDVKRLQSWIDRRYRYVWSNRNGEPLRQMERRGVNMVDVRACLGVKSLQWKIEKRVLERIGHVMRMGNERLTKVAVLGWYEKLEGESKMKGRKRKTVLYWKRLMREAGIDWTDVERLSGDRVVWKSLVNERMEHLDVWERQKGHKYEWDEGEEVRVRNVRRRDEEFVCRYEECGKRCKSKAGRTMHEKRMHRVVEERVRFECEKCGEKVETAGAKVNHERACMGGGRRDGRRECVRCGSWVTVSNWARHRGTCGGGEEGAVGGAVVEERSGGVRGAGRRGRVKACPGCGLVLTVANMARHQRAACRMVWDPGGGPIPDGGERPRKEGYIAGRE